MDLHDENIVFVDQVKIDEAAPTFDLPAYDPEKDDVVQVSSNDLKGKWNVLFFYPADFTFVCPTELSDMAKAKSKFDALNINVYTVSTDTVYSHKAWIEHEGLMKNFPYLMLADNTLDTAEAYNVLGNDGLAGRGTFIIDPEGICRGIEVTSGPLGRNSEELLRKIEALQYMEENPGTACPAMWTPGEKTLSPSIKISGKVAEELE